MQYANRRPRAVGELQSEASGSCVRDPAGNGFLWTGWILEQNHQGSTLHEFVDGEVLAWMRLPVHEGGRPAIYVGPWAAIVDAATRYLAGDRETATMATLASARTFLSPTTDGESDAGVCAHILAAELADVRRQLVDARDGYRCYAHQAGSEIARLTRMVDLLRLIGREHTPAKRDALGLVPS